MFVRQCKKFFFFFEGFLSDSIHIQIFTHSTYESLMQQGTVPDVIIVDLGKSYYPALPSFQY